jgi:hypothetical protein
LIRVTLLFNRQSGAGTYNDGYADNLLLELTPIGAPLPTVSCTAATPGGGGSGGNGGGGTGGGGTGGGGTGGGGGVGGAPPSPFLVLQKSNSARLSSSKSTIGVPLTCDAHDAPCAGSVTVTMASLPRAASVKLGAASFSIAPAATKSVQVRLGRSARRRLRALSKRQLRRLRLTARVTVGSASTSFRLRLKS